MFRYFDLTGYFFYYRRGGVLMLVAPDGNKMKSTVSESTLVGHGARYGTGPLSVQAL